MNKVSVKFLFLIGILYIGLELMYKIELLLFAKLDFDNVSSRYLQKNYSYQFQVWSADRG